MLEPEPVVPYKLLCQDNASCGPFWWKLHFTGWAYIFAAYWILRRLVLQYVLQSGTHTFPSGRKMAGLPIVDWILPLLRLVGTRAESDRCFFLKHKMQVHTKTQKSRSWCMAETVRVRTWWRWKCSRWMWLFALFLHFRCKVSLSRMTAAVFWISGVCWRFIFGACMLWCGDEALFPIRPLWTNT